MKSVSKDYKEIMARQIRNRAYISVGLGVVNQDAQKDAAVATECVSWCNRNAIFDNTALPKIYATMEQNFLKMDGSMVFMPETYLQELSACAITPELLGSLRITFDNVYAIKGLTLDFGDAYPTELTIETAEKLLTYTNDVPKFVTTDVLGDTDYIVITPHAMIGGQQRLRIYSVIMGVGLTFSNADIQSASMNDGVSTISEELPNAKLSLSIFDKENKFHVDDDNSFIQFLEVMQKVTLSFGLELDSGKVEWLKYATLFLSDWDSEKGMLTVNAVDRISQMEDEYSLGNKIYERTAYEEALSIMEDAGLEPEEYILDECLRDVVLNNPMPVATHKECLQLLANACRCILLQDPEGRIVIKANFANVIGPDDMVVGYNDIAPWSHPENILYGTEYVYADMTKRFFQTDGNMYFLPENESFLATAYVSKEISDENGLFAENPWISLSLPAAYMYYGVTIKFDGNPPKEVIVHTYANGVPVQEVVFTDLMQESTLYHEFAAFDKMVFEFSKAEPHNRILVNEIEFGDFSDYVLTKDMMLEHPHGYSEGKVKSVSVKVFTYENNEDGEPEEIKDEVYVKKELMIPGRNYNAGKNKICQNPLVSTREHAELLAEWLGNFYANSISYDVNYRGEPRLSVGDIIRMDSDMLDNLQVEIVSQALKFDGTFSGSLELRKALRMVK